MIFTYFWVRYNIVKLQTGTWLHISTIAILRYALFYFHLHSEGQNTKSADTESLQGHWLLVLFILSGLLDQIIFMKKAIQFTNECFTWIW